MKKLNKRKPVISTGDFNVAHNEIDLKNPETNHFNPGFSDEEREGFSNLLSKGFIDSFRYLYPNKIEYSWFSTRTAARERNAGWRIDYFLIADSLKDNLLDSRIISDDYSSDHLPIVLEMEF